MFQCVKSDVFWIQKHQEDYGGIDVNINAQKEHFRKFNAIVLMPDDQYDKEEEFGILMRKMIQRLEYLERNSNKPTRIFFTSEYDSNRTEFEELAVYMKIGTVSKCSTVGFALLMLVKFLIDYRLDIHNYYPIDDENKEYSYSNMIECFCSRTSSQGDVFNLNEPFKRNMYRYVDNIDGESIRINYELIREFSDIDIWTLERVRKEIELNY